MPWSLDSLEQATVNLLPTQLLALVGHPVTLLGAPAPGKANLIVAMSASLTFGGAAYANPGGAAANLIYNGPSQLAAVGSNNLAALLQSGSSQLQVLAALATTLARGETEGQAILLSNPGA